MSANTRIATLFHEIVVLRLAAVLAANPIPDRSDAGASGEQEVSQIRAALGHSVSGLGQRKGCGTQQENQYTKTESLQLVFHNAPKSLGSPM